MHPHPHELHAYHRSQSSDVGGERNPLVATLSLDEDEARLHRTHSGNSFTYSTEKSKSMSEIAVDDPSLYSYGGQSPGKVSYLSEGTMSVSMVEPVTHTSHAYIRSQSHPADFDPNLSSVSKPITIETSGDDWRRPGNQRRGSRDQKRYYTADAIQDMTKDNKDKTIHKRLSLNMPPAHPVDGHIEHRQGILKNKTWSNDSLRSMHSSSGVSSTASLHLSPESEICEENETESSSGHSIRFATEYTHPETVIISQHTVTQPHVHAKESSDEGKQLSEDDKQYSKSLPDISLITQPHQVQEGIGSVRIQGEQGHKMTHKQLRQMRKQLLLNSTLEAS